MVRGRLAWVALLAAASVLSASPSKPNIVYILCDDLGYGDVHCFNPESKIATPQADRLAASGMIFTGLSFQFRRMFAVTLRRHDRPLQLALAT
jgi:hypothetical protein